MKIITQDHDCTFSDDLHLSRFHTRIIVARCSCHAASHRADALFITHQGYAVIASTNDNARAFLEGHIRIQVLSSIFYLSA